MRLTTTENGDETVRFEVSGTFFWSTLVCMRDIYIHCVSTSACACESMHVNAPEIC